MDFPMQAREDGRNPSYPTLGELTQLLNEMVVMPALDRCVLAAAATSDSNDRFERLVAVLRADPLLATRVLRVANSAYFGRKRTVGSIEVALAVLGTEAVSAITLAASFEGVFAGRGPRDEMLQTLRRHGLWTAALARRLAHFDGQADCSGDEAFIAGLMHDLGTLVKRQSLVSQPGLAPLDHAFIGAALLASWDMPPALVEAVRRHHQAAATLPAGDVSAVLWAADGLAHWINADEAHECSVGPEQLEDHLAVTRDQLIELAAQGSRDARQVEELIR
jgi:HD-like signal output (HDOD) protein